MLWINLGLGAIAVLLLIPMGTFCLECLVAILPHRSRSALAPPPRFAVLIPAHNEAIGIRATLEHLLPQVSPSDRVVVVADNCSDETAAIARATGATVLERENLQHRGKGYALDFGLAYLAQDPPDVVVMVDADCEMQPGSVPEIAALSAQMQRPVQALYLMERPKNPSPKDSISALAFLVKNWVRPRGLAQMGFPCLLTGTGMAFPWDVIRYSPLASGNIVEDMQLGVDLAIAGASPLFCETAQAIGRLPQQEQAATSQRTRWEHGHLQTLISQVPRLLASALTQFRLDLVAIALDLAVPPLSLLVMIWAAGLVITSLPILLGASMLPGAIVAIEGGGLLLAIFLAWWRFGRQTVPIMTLLSVPFYILWKIPLYFKFLVRPQTQWVRTERDATDSSDSPSSSLDLHSKTKIDP